MRASQIVSGVFVAVASCVGPMRADAQTWFGWNNVCQSFTNVFGHPFGGSATVAFSVAPDGAGGTYLSFQYLITNQAATFFQGTPSLGFAYNAPFGQQNAAPSGNSLRVFPIPSSST